MTNAILADSVPQRPTLESCSPGQVFLGTAWATKRLAETGLRIVRLANRQNSPLASFRAQGETPSDNKG
jgi:hypothetical protein